MKPLHRLPNGCWIALEQVTDIVPLEGSFCEITGTVHTPRVVVRASGQDYSVVEFDQDADPHLWADWFAAQVNEARSKE